MVDIVDTLINFLCQQNTASQCSQFISEYPDITQQIVWLVFFPAIFLIIFIMLIADGVVKNSEHKKYKGLLSVAIFVFIIFQGWFHYVLNISKIWFIGLIVLGGLYVFTHRMGAAGGGGAKAGRSLFSRTAGKVIDKGVNKAIDDIVDALDWTEGREKSIKNLAKRIEKGEKLTQEQLKLYQALSASLSSSTFARAMKKNPDLAGDRALLLEALRNEKD